jgi:hypothetical protein
MNKAMSTIILMVCICVLFSNSVYMSGINTTEISDLKSRLLTGYRNDVRPTYDSTMATHVNMSFSLLAIQNVDEVDGVLSLIGTIMTWWTEPRFTWDQEQYGGIQYILFSQEDVWTPPLILQKPSKKFEGLGNRFFLVKYYWNGLALWYVTDVINTACNIDVTYYPFDIQTCPIMFIPLGYEPVDLVMHSSEKSFITDYLEESGEWIISNPKSVSGNFFGYNSYTLFLATLERRSKYFVINVIVPVLFLAILNSLVFILPVESGERVSYAITVLLSIAVFLTLVGDNIPKSSKPMSLFSYYLLNNLILSTVIMFTTIVNLKVYHRHVDKPVPKWLSTTVRKLQCCCCCGYLTIHPSQHSSAPVKNGSRDNDFDGNTSEKTTQSRDLASTTTDGTDVTWPMVSGLLDGLMLAICILWILGSTIAFLIVIKRGGIEYDLEAFLNN